MSSIRLPAAPEMGDPLPVTPSHALATALAHRRSSSAASLSAPGPNAEELHDILTLACRAPDHGKLEPWRFILLSGDAKAQFAEEVRRLASSQAEPAKAEGALIKLTAPPLAVVVVSSPKPAKIPAWEQHLSAGAVCTLLLLAAQAFGFGANWITDWYGYAPEVQALLGLEPQERVAGFIYIGSAKEAPLERVRPELDRLIVAWNS